MKGRSREKGKIRDTEWKNVGGGSAQAVQRPLKHKHEYIMHNANTTTLTLTCAFIAAVLSLGLSLQNLLKAVVIISELQSLKSARTKKKKLKGASE